MRWHGKFSQRTAVVDEEDDLARVTEYLVKIKYPRDIVYAFNFDAQFVASCIAASYLPISCRNGGAANDYLLLPKIHEERSVLQLAPFVGPPPCGAPSLRPRCAKKCGASFFLTVNTAFAQNVAALNQFHSESSGRHQSWLYPPLLAAFFRIHLSGGVSVTDSWGTTVVFVHSVELWNSDRELVAGEIGVSVGNLYTSLTGWRQERATQRGVSLGSLQLKALIRLLAVAGFRALDFGMDMRYKSDLGASLLPRKDFVELVRACRGALPPPPVLPHEIFAAESTKTDADAANPMISLAQIFQGAIPTPAVANPASKRQRKKAARRERRLAARRASLKESCSA